MIDKEDATIVNAYAPNIKSPNSKKQTLVITKRQIGPNAIISRRLQ